MTGETLMNCESKITLNFEAINKKDYGSESIK